MELGVFRLLQKAHIGEARSIPSQDHHNRSLASEDRCHCHIHLQPTPSYPQSDRTPQPSSFCCKNMGSEVQRS